MSERITGKKLFACDGLRPMKTITMTDLRSEPGERIRDVQRKNKSFLITKAGKPAAKLVPVDSPPLIFLVLCEADRKRVLAEDRCGGWIGLPKVCPECEAKIAQVTRILVTGGAIVPNVENIRTVPGGAMHETRLERS